MASAQQRQAGVRQQPLVLLMVVLVLCSAMVSRLVWMQLLEGSRFKELADENRIRLVPRSPFEVDFWIGRVVFWPRASSRIPCISSHAW